MVKKKHLFQISVRELQNDMILPSSGEVFPGARTVDGKKCTGYKSFRKYMPKYIKLTSNRNNITCGYETCIGAMLLQSDFNK